MRFKLIIAYDGTEFLGWQSQKGGGAVQDVIEAALRKVLKKEIRIHGASRTDSGVHAWGQTAHFDADWPHGCAKLKKAIQALLPPTILIRSLTIVPDKFHARFSAKGKKYLYRLKLTPATPFETRTVYVPPYKISLPLLKKTLALFVGRHDFRSLAAHVNTGETSVKTIRRISVRRSGPYVTIAVIGSGFMYKMVRGLVGGALEVARGKLALERVKELLLHPARTHEIVIAPARGLILEKVYYARSL
jgi:tRNA pseudouridine38-40 synthase